MGQIIIHPETNTHPITTIGRMVGICYGSDVSDDVKNYKRGLNCMKAGHGRVMEFATCFMSLQGYSARVIREFYTHIGGSPTRVQESTRYIDYSNFKYITPPAIQKDKDANDIYEYLMYQISEAAKDLKACGVPKEDIANIFPLGMETGISCHFNLRTLENMANQRLCTRAYWEYRQLMKDMRQALGEYSYEWGVLCDIFFIPKCEKYGYCCEEYSCGRYPKKIDL